MYKIFKRSLAILLSLVLCFQIFPVMAQENIKDVTAVDFTKRSVAENAGLYVSTLYRKSGKVTSVLSGKNLEKNYSVSSRKDWSQHTALQMWVYSPKGVITPISFALVSENPNTVGRDFYYVTAYIGALGWNSVYIPYNGQNSLFYEKGSPLGLDKISSVEILTQFDGEFADTNAELYFDEMILTNKSASDFVATADLVGAGSVTENPNKKDEDSSETEVYGSFVLESSSVNLNDIKVNDWTKYNTLVIRATNEKKSERAYDVNVYAENPATSGPDYYQFFIQADWEGTKEFSFDIRDGGSFTKARTPLGWDQINKIIFSTYASALQNKWGTLNDDQTHIQVEGIYLTNRDYDYLFADDAEDYILDAKLEHIDDSKGKDYYIDYAAEIHARTPGHPRLLINQEYLNELKELMKTDAYVKNTVEKIRGTVEENMKKGPVSKPSSDSPTQLGSAALLYNLTFEQKYADYIWQSMLNLSRNANNWNTANSQALMLGDTMRAVAFTYDWMYNHWTDSQRRIVRNAMMHFGLEVSLPYLRPYKDYWGGKGGNWCQIILSGVGLTALAMCDDPAYDNLVSEIIHRCIVGLSYTHDQTISADGSYVEGASYWGYGMGNYIPFIGALYETTGSNELFELPGMDKTGLFPIGVNGPMGYYGFGDASSSGTIIKGAFFYLSRYFNDPTYGAYQYSSTISSGGDWYSLAMYRPDERYTEFAKYMPDYFHFPGDNDLITIRPSWTDKNSAFLGCKAGKNNISHSNLDIGSYIFDLMGVRWAYELGSDNYTDAYLYEDGKWVFYRNRAEGQNALVINPDGSIDQNVNADCKIGDYKVNDNGAYVTMDITDAYKDKGVDSVKRGFAMLNNYGALLVQDEIMSSLPVEAYTFMHTKAEIEVSEDGKSAILTQDGQKLRARILSPSEGVFIDMPADPLPSSPNPPEAYPRNGFRKLAVHVENVLSPTISMLLTPYNEDESSEFTIERLLPIRQFKNYIKESVKVNSIFLDGIPLQGFDSSVSTYVLNNEFEVGTIEATSSGNVAVTVKQAENIGDSAYVIAESEKTGSRAIYTISFTDELQKMLDKSSYPIERIFAQSSQNMISRIVDGDSSTDWSISTPGWIAFDFGRPRELRELQAIWYKGNERVAYFDIDVSDDGVNWQTVFSGESLVTDGFETYTFEPVKARYIRINGKGNSKNSYVSICEVRVTEFEDKFTDMASHWAKRDVDHLANMGLIQGMEDGSFNPDGTMTRAEFAALIQNVTSIKSVPYSGTISDLSADSEIAKTVEGLLDSGVIPAEMIADGAFYPNKAITCEEAMSICILSINNLRDIKPYYSTLDDYEYADNVSSWCLNYMKNARAQKLLNPSLMDTGFNPTANITRAQAAVLAKRVYVKLY